MTSFGAAQCQLVELPLIYTSSTASGSGLAPTSGSPDNCAAFAAAIAACNRAGGGKVIVSAGNWYCAGPITLLSNVNFHLQSGAQIWFSPNPADYGQASAARYWYSKKRRDRPEKLLAVPRARGGS